MSNTTSLYTLNQRAINILHLANGELPPPSSSSKASSSSSFPLTRDPICWWNPFACSCYQEFLDRYQHHQQQDKTHSLDGITTAASTSLHQSHHRCNQRENHENDESTTVGSNSNNTTSSLLSLSDSENQYISKVEHLLASALGGVGGGGHIIASASTTTNNDAIVTSHLTFHHNHHRKNGNTQKCLILRTVSVPCCPHQDPDYLHHVVASASASSCLAVQRNNNGEQKDHQYHQYQSPRQMMMHDNLKFVLVKTIDEKSLGWIPECALSKVHEIPISKKSTSSSSSIYFSHFFSSASSGSSSSSNSKTSSSNGVVGGGKSVVADKRNDKQQQELELFNKLKREMFTSSSASYLLQNSSSCTSIDFNSYANSLFKFKLSRKQLQQQQQQQQSVSSNNNINNNHNNPSSSSSQNQLNSSKHSSFSAKDNNNHNSSNSSALRSRSPSTLSSKKSSYYQQQHSFATINEPEILPITLEEARTPPPYLSAAPLQHNKVNTTPSNSTSYQHNQQQQPKIPLSCKFDLRHYVVFSGSNNSNSDNGNNSGSPSSAILGQGGSGFVLMGAVRNNLRQDCDELSVEEKESTAPTSPNNTTTVDHDENTIMMKREASRIASASLGALKDRINRENNQENGEPQIVAVKVIPLPSFSSSKFEHLRREIILHALTSAHPNFVKLFGVYPIYATPGSTSTVVTPDTVLKHTPPPASLFAQHLATTTNNPHHQSVVSPDLGPSSPSSSSPIAIGRQASASSSFHHHHQNRSSSSASFPRVIAIALVFPFCDGGSVDTLLSATGLAVVNNNNNNNIITHQQSSSLSQSPSPNSHPQLQQSSSSPPPAPRLFGSPDRIQQQQLLESVFGGTRRDDVNNNNNKNQPSPNRALNFGSSSTIQTQNTNSSGSRQRPSPPGHNNDQSQPTPPSTTASFSLAPLREFELTSILYSVVTGLNFLHEELGCAHRDIKPGNILLTSRGEVLIADLGIAKQVATPKGGDFRSTTIYCSSTVVALHQECGGGGVLVPASMLPQHQHGANKNATGSSTSATTSASETSGQSSATPPVFQLVPPSALPSAKEVPTVAPTTTIDNKSPSPNTDDHHQSPDDQQASSDYHHHQKLPFVRTITPPPAISNAGQATLVGTPLFLASEILEHLFSSPARTTMLKIGTANNNNNNNNDESKPHVTDDDPNPASAPSAMIDLRRADMFSLGVVMRMFFFPGHLLESGEIPEAALNRAEVLNGSRGRQGLRSDENDNLARSLLPNEDEIEHHLIHPSISDSCKELISNLLARNPKERFSCDDVLTSPFIRSFYHHDFTTSTSSTFSSAVASLVALRIAEDSMFSIVFDNDVDVIANNTAATIGKSSNTNPAAAATMIFPSSSVSSSSQKFGKFSKHVGSLSVILKKEQEQFEQFQQRQAELNSKRNRFMRNIGGSSAISSPANYILQSQNGSIQQVPSSSSSPIIQNHHHPPLAPPPSAISQEEEEQEQELEQQQLQPEQVVSLMDVAAARKKRRSSLSATTNASDVTTPRTEVRFRAASFSSTTRND